MSTVTILENTFGAFSALYGLWYGIVTYFGLANEVLGPEGGAFQLYREPIHPIADFYMRLHGATTLYLVFAWYLFCRGSKERQRALSKGFLATWTAAAFNMIRVALNDEFEDKYVANNWKQLIFVCFLHIAFFVSVLSYHHTDIVQETPLHPVDRIGLLLVIPYLGQCTMMVVTGPERVYFPLEKLDGGDYSLEMIESALMCGASLLAPFTILITGDAFKMPKFLWQHMCLHMAFLIPLEYKMAFEKDGFGSPLAFQLLLASMALALPFGYQRLGAFDKVTPPPTASTIPKKVASKAA